MAGELQTSVRPSLTIYFLIRNRIGQIWNATLSAFETFTLANYADYVISATEQTGSQGYYTATFPTAITAGIYNIVAKQQTGGSPAAADVVVALGTENWNGSAIFPMSDLATSGQVGQFAPIRATRGAMISNWKFKLVSSADHVTPFVSGVISGQISRDNGSFGVLQSGGFTELGLGWYNTNLTSGDMLANTVALVFTGVGISGGSADQRDFFLLTQKTSGQ